MKRRKSNLVPGSVVFAILWFRIVVHISIPLLVSVTFSDLMCVLLLATLRWIRHPKGREDEESDPVIDDDLRDKLTNSRSLPTIEVRSPTKSITPSEATRTLRTPEDPSYLGTTAVAEVREGVDGSALGLHLLPGRSNTMGRPSKPGPSFDLLSQTRNPFAEAGGWDQGRDTNGSLSQRKVPMARARQTDPQGRSREWPSSRAAGGPAGRPAVTYMKTILEETHPSQRSAAGAQGHELLPPTSIHSPWATS